MPAPASAPAPQVDEQKIRAQLRKWQECLLDLTKANPLLGLNRSRVSKLQIVAPSSAELFNRLALEEGEMKLPLVIRQSRREEQQELLEGPPGEPVERLYEYRIEPGDVEFSTGASELMRRLRRIYDNARTSVEERGVTTLHVTFGILKWRDDWLGESLSPLWMVPAQLVSKGPSAALRLSVADEEMQLNPALALYLRLRHKCQLPELPEEPKAESLTNFFDDVGKLVGEQRWTISPEVWLSTFSFESLVIYQDLDAMADAAVRHPVVATLARAMPASEVSDSLSDDLDELQTPEVVPVPVLPADSTQLEALAYAASGAHVVIHGPPGTGKSQSISNLIADALGRGKTVLFVSSKMAALNVVHQRLADKGLAPFCLEAHSTKAGKTKIIDELRRTLENEYASDGGRFTEELQELLRTRSALNSYVQELHQLRQPLGLTAYQVFGRVAALAAAPDLRASLPWPDVLKVSQPDLRTRMDALTELSTHALVFDVRDTHPWRGCVATTMTILEQEKLEHDLQAIAAVAETLPPLLLSLAALAAEAQSLTLSQLDQLSGVFLEVADLDQLPQEWCAQTPEQLKALAVIFETTDRLQADFEQQHAAFAAAFDLPLRTAEALLKPAISGFGQWFRRASVAYWRWRGDVKRHLKGPFSYANAKHQLAIVQRLLEIDNWFEQYRPEITHEIGAAEWRRRDLLVLAAKRCRVAATLVSKLAVVGHERGSQCLVSEQLREALKRVASVTPGHSPVLAEALRNIERDWPSGFVEGAHAQTAELGTVLSRARELLSARNSLQPWISLQRVLQKCEALQLSPFIAELGCCSRPGEAQRTSAASARAAFERRFFAVWVSTIVAQSNALSAFGGEGRNALIEKFRKLDLDVSRLASLNIQAKAAEASHRLRKAQTTVNGSEVGILRRELQKRRRIKPLRKLFAEIPHALQALKPCMLMSPISVSTYLKPGTAGFDLVVFDEASQLPAAEGIASVLRAKQVIVAGDRNQLPPTSFFRANIEMEEDSEEQQEADEPLESLLDEAVAAVPLFREAYLKWHYRSKDERLIKFSNSYFYENRLITFPSANTSENSRGVRLEYLADGVWDRGKSRTNRREARRVAELTMEHFSEHPDRSLGIVSMNIQQKEAIEDAIGELIQERPDVGALLDPSRAEPFFVKALENVQGDERDTIMISVGYGKDPTGHASSNFGPINREGGWRRLNVIVTRAKWQTILVTSIRSLELSDLNPENRGPVALRNFISYAERHCELPPSPSIPILDAETNDFEDSVAAILRDRGYFVDQQVGASKFRIDLAVRHREDTSRYVLGVECDGATYHSSHTARDRDILREQVLRSMGWRIHRVWSTEWFHNKEQAVARLLKDLELAEKAPIEESVQGTPLLLPALPSVAPSPNRDEPISAAAPRRYRAGIPYRAFKGAGDRELLLNSRRSHDLAALVTRIVAVEGPIHEDLLAERLKQVCDVARAGSNIQSNVGEAIHVAVRRNGLESRRQRSFVWQKGMSLETFRQATEDVKRPIAWVHKDEVALAALYIVEDQLSIPCAEVARVVCRLFGIERMTEEAADYISDVVDELVDKRLLVEAEARLSLAL